MSETPRPAEAASMSDLLEQSLERSRGENAQLMNAVRLVLVAGFVLLYAHGILVLKLESMHATVPFVSVYLVLAFALWYFGSRTPALVRMSRVAIPMIDLPMVTIIQYVNLPLTESPPAVQAFTLSIYLFLIVMASFSLKPWKLYVCAGLASVCVEILVHRVGLRVITAPTPPLMLFVTAWMVSHQPRRQAELLRSAAEKQARRDRLALYFSPGVAEIIESHSEPGVGEYCELSVLFCDIRGFTGLSEELEPAEVVALLNDFHGHMVDAVFRYGGTLDKYLGDGLLAYFNAPVRQTDHAERAVRCALAMIEALHDFNEQRKTDGADPIRIGIGVHSGQAVVGNVGASHRREYTAIGDTVNVASRLQDLTKAHGVDLLISETVVEHIGALDGIEFSAIDRVEVRGRRQPVELFALSA